jgi:hypothetical protein
MEGEIPFERDEVAEMILGAFGVLAAAEKKEFRGVRLSY